MKQQSIAIAGTTLLISLVLVGCASSGKYRNSPSDWLCREYNSNWWLNVNQAERKRELERRGVDCSVYDGSYQSNMSPQEAALMMQMLNQPQQQTYQRPQRQQGLNCISTTDGSNTYTNCR